jgi:hypothetical protein
MFSMMSSVPLGPFKWLQAVAVEIARCEMRSFVAMQQRPGAIVAIRPKAVRAELGDHVVLAVAIEITSHDAIAVEAV